MDTVGIKDIAALFAKRTKLGNIEAEAFINSMFLVIRQGLEADRQVKIRGFGTFKVIDVEDRESVNVNTGERVVIKGHGKVTFTPDATMKELVNKPFALFTTVALNDGVEFDDSDADDPTDGDGADQDGNGEWPTEQPVADAEPQPVITEGVEPEPQPTASENVEAESQPVATEDIEASPQYVATETVGEEPQSVASEGVEAEPQPAAAVANESEASEPVVLETEVVGPSEENAAADASPVESLPHEEPQEEEQPRGGTGNDGDVDDSTEAAGTDEATEEVEEETACRRHSRRVFGVLLYGLVTLILMGASAYLGMEYGRREATATSGAVAKPAAAVERPSAESQPKPQVQPSDTAKANAAENAAQETAAEPRNAEKEPQGNDGKADDGMDAAQVAARYAEKDIRVRTGAYSITGLDHTVKVKEGESLKSISEHELGRGMACYVEVFNGLAEGSEVKPGQTLKIPKLQLRKSLRKNSE